MAGVTGPDNAEAFVDVPNEEGGIDVLMLRFPCGAIVALQAAMGDDSDFAGCIDLVDKLTPKTLHLFVWASRLHEDRSYSIEDAEALVNWGGVPFTVWGQAVMNAWIRAQGGTIEVEDAGKVRPVRRFDGVRSSRLWSVLSGSRRKDSGGDTPPPTVSRASPVT